MNLAILFWFYKEPEICKNRLKLLKKHNPELKIFGLYGGENKEQEYKTRIGKYLDDFYVLPFQDASWKWLNGDLMILDWYDKRGRNLNWDSIVVIQWDTLVFDSLMNQFPGIKKGEIFLSGLRNLDQTIEERWYWTRPRNQERKNYLAFLDYIKNKYSYVVSPLCCLFILQVFPREFFDRYLAVKDKKVGMLEYKVPTYAKIFNTSFYKKDLGVKWFGKKEGPLNAIPKEINRSYIEKELKIENGWRIFHPYYKIWH